MKLYHYTTFESFCKIWATQRIRFSDSLRTNDLFEQRKGLPSIRRLHTKEEFQNAIEALKKFEGMYMHELALYKQISFTKDYFDDNIICEGWQSSMMWGQYAKNSGGVCIELDSEKLPKDKNRLEDDIKYMEEMPFLHNEDELYCDEKEIRDYINRNIKNIFFVKHKHWEHENEYRMIKRGTEDMYLSIVNAVKNIYTYSLTDINSKIIEKFIPNDVSIYALWIEAKGDKKVIEKVDYRRYQGIMDGRIQPSKGPHVSLKNCIFPKNIKIESI